MTSTATRTRRCNAAHVGCTCTDDTAHRTWVDANSRDVTAADLRDGDVVYLCGTWQTIHEPTTDGDVVHARTDGGTAFLGTTSTRYARLIDDEPSGVMCVCGAIIHVQRDERGLFSECGGKGEGSCDAVLNATDHLRDAAIAHRMAIASVTR